MNGEIKQYSLEWYKEMRKLNKDTIISLVESNGKQRDTLKEQITKLQSELKAADSINQWISVEDRLPEIGDGFNLLSDDVLVFTKDKDFKTAYYDHNIDDWILMSGTVAHWMPLPNQPK